MKDKFIISIVIVIVIFLIILSLSLVTASENVQLIYGQNSPFIKCNLMNNDEIKYYWLGSKFGGVKNAIEYYRGSIVNTNIIHKTYHYESSNPTILNWHYKKSIDENKPLIVLVVMLGFLMPDLISVIDEIQDIINNDPNNEYVVVSIERTFLTKSVQIKQLDELSFFDDSSTVYWLIDIVKEKYPLSLVCLYGYSLGATSIYDYLHTYDNLQDIKVCILNSPVFDITNYFNSNRHSSKFFGYISRKKLKDIIISYKHLFKSEEEITLFNKLINSQTIKELTNEWLLYKNKNIKSIHDTKNVTVPMLAILAKNDPLLSYTYDNISKYCTDFSMLTCLLFASGEHITFKDINNKRITPSIIHKSIQIISDQLRESEKNKIDQIVLEMNNDGVNDIDKFGEIIEIPDP